ncbi:hypothetical protein SAMN05444287_2584 [Octadecabacter temperatus]|uniref:Uncharacterized protein n=1 Tax=Octadecabacter temperatus TaxID=1458307 RepID=A0A0K0YA00_9RHOB|nr:hypothetical protein [Octadecabacter temperatus]AKS47759.1 hypothetical protein OSB_32460 [Octadecabacter temperatus]SIO38872.1 hypothetical protein SAMN05444287_2584 [Octadecabacter temperatus]
MAKSSKGSSKKSKIDKSVEDVVEVVDTGLEPTDNETAQSNDIPDDEDGLGFEAEVSKDEFEMEVVNDEVINEPTPDLADEAIVAETVVPNESSKSGGFFPLLLGGVAAGAIGYGIATFYPLNAGSAELEAQFAAQSEKIAAIEAQLAEAPELDVSAIETQISESAAQTTGQIENVAASLEDQLSALDVRISDIEKAPNSDGTLSETAIAAYQQELEELRAELTTQQEAVMTAAAQTEAELAAAREEALATAQAATSRAVLNRVSEAVDTGVPFADSLAELEGVDLPIALTNAADAGVATIAELADAFPAAARAALATARAEGVSDDAGGIGGFLRNQFDVRSTAPQEGPGPDAVLSRAEAAIKEGRVSDSLAEIEALPEVVRAEMTDWTALATERANVLDAISTLSETYN